MIETVKRTVVRKHDYNWLHLGDYFVCIVHPFKGTIMFGKAWNKDIVFVSMIVDFINEFVELPNLIEEDINNAIEIGYFVDCDVPMSVEYDETLF